MNDDGKAGAGTVAGAAIGITGTLALIGVLAVAGPLTVEWGEQGAAAEDTSTGTENAPETTPPPGDDATTSPPQDEPVETFVAAYAQVSDGVVRIVREGCEDGGSTGSGALVAPDLVLTAAHVVAGYSSIQLQLGDQAVVGEVVGYSAAEDLALVMASRPLEGHVFELLAEPADIGTPVAALGYPRSGRLSLAGPGVVSTYGEDINYEIDGAMVEVVDLMRITTPTNPGNSGGPVIDEAGRVAGVVAARSRTLGEVHDDGTVVVDIVAGFDFAVPVDVASLRLEEWMSEPAPVEPESCDAPPETDLPAALVTASMAGPDVDMAVHVLFDYFDGVNRSDYERAYRQLSEDRRARDSLESFTDGQTTSDVSDVVVLDAWQEEGNLRAVVTFRSRQAPEHGPDGLDCAYWTLDYTFVAGGEHGWAIDTAVGVDPDQPFEGCT